MKKIFSLLFIIIFTINAFACLNGETKTLKDGTLLYEDYDGSVPYGHNIYINEDLKKALINLENLYNKTKDVDYISDKGLVLILLGNYDEAIQLYENLEKTNPNRYSTASNLGTAYELKGDNHNALKWIKKAVEINPQSHENSEWIHVKILEAKINGTKNINSKSLLNVDFGSDLIPQSVTTKEELQNLYDQIYFQLNERVTFVKPKEKIVAQLYFDLGNIAFLLKQYQNAIGNYNQAIEYGFSGNLIQQRLTEIIKQEKQATISSQKNNFGKVEIKTEIYYGNIALILLGFISLILLIFWLIKRRNKKNVA